MFNDSSGRLGRFYTFHLLRLDINNKTTAKMRFLSTITAGVFAAVASAQEPVTGPFYLTFVAENGTEYPATIGEASRGIKILSAWTEYNQQFTFEA